MMVALQAMDMASFQQRHCSTTMTPFLSCRSLTHVSPSQVFFFTRTSQPSSLGRISTQVKAESSEQTILVSSNTSYAAPLEVNSGSSFMVRPLAEILRDLNKRVPDQILREGPGNRKFIPWYHANRMLSFYAPGWCGEVRDITFSSDGKFVTVIYRVTIRGSDREALREASGTVCTAEAMPDPVQEAEATAFVRACARFGLGLYLHHSEYQ